MSLMLLTRPEPVATTVLKGLSPAGVCFTLKQHPGSKEESRHLILVAEGPASHRC